MAIPDTQPYAPAQPMLFPEDYCWVDRQGRPTSPPQPPAPARPSSRGAPAATERNQRKVGERAAGRAETKIIILKADFSALLLGGWSGIPLIFPTVEYSVFLPSSRLAVYLMSPIEFCSVSSGSK